MRSTLSTFLKGMRRADPGAVCSTYTREVRALVGRTLDSDCATGMDFAFGALGVSPRAFRTVSVGRLEITGDRAVAELVLPPRLRSLPLVQIIAPRQELTLQREAGRWRLGLAVL